jgi:hypothetical protein
MHNIYKSELSDYLVPAKEKEKLPYLIGMADTIINDLVNESSEKRRKLLQMRAMRDGIRDPQEFAYLTDNYGVGNPSDIKFTPVIRNRIDALIGYLSTTDFRWKMTITDPESINKLDHEKSSELLRRIYEEFYKSIGTTGVNFSIESLVEKLQSQMGNDWRSALENATNNLIKYYKDDEDIDLRELRKLALEDVLTVGEMVYRNRCQRAGETPKPEVLLPENFYADTPRDAKSYKESPRAVYIKYMSMEDILMTYGHLMDKEAKKELFERSYSKYTLSAQDIYDINRSNGISKEGRERQDPDNQLLNNQRYFRVYETEWIANNPSKVDSKDLKNKMLIDGPDKVQNEEYTQDRYEVTRIGEEIYVSMGKSKYVKRTKKAPRKAYLSFNGIRFESRGGQPYSLTWKCKDIQDMSDIIRFHRDNLLANTTVGGSRMDVSTLPDFLGDSMMERLMKVIALRKNGVEVYNSAQNEGNHVRGQNISGEYRSSVDGPLINAINSIIDQLDSEATKLTGVTPQMMGIIEQRDAVSNVKVGVSQSSVVVKNVFDQHDRFMRSMISDLLHMHQVSFAESDEEEFVGTFMGDVNFQAFRIKTKDVALSDINLHVVSSSEDKAKITEVKQAIISLANTGNVSPNLIAKIITADTVSEVLRHIEELSESTKDSTQIIEDLNARLEEMAKENEKLQKSMSGKDDAEQKLKVKELEIKSAEADKKLELEERKIFNQQEYNDKIIALKEETVKLERDQLILGSGASKEIRNDI